MISFENLGAVDGRVSKLENWQNFIKGEIAILTILVIPILLLLLTGHLSK